MAEPSSVVWPAEPHTRAKHAILGLYLQAWLPILSSASAQYKNTELRYVDGFAGPGIYKGGEPGSPVVAIKTALNHEKGFAVPIRFTFIEEDPARCAQLKVEL